MGYQEDFTKRTKAHIDRVNKYASKIGESYPDHDMDKLSTLFEGYSLMHKEDITEEEQAKIDEATYKHVISNPHHCEYWSLTSIEGFTRNNPNPNGPLNVMLMPQSALKHMCCDWSAMSEEFGNTPFEWLDKVKDVRWKFTNEQLDFIKYILDQLWEK